MSSVYPERKNRAAVSLPLIELQSGPYVQGMLHGRALSADIRHNLALYFDRFEREGHLSRAETSRRGSLYWDAIQQDDPRFAAGIQGIAAGAELPLLDVVALNVRYELLYHQFGLIAQQTHRAVQGVDGCTAFAIHPAATRDGRLLVGQNWDWIPEVRGALLHTVETDGFETLAFAEAGMFGGKIGLSSAGVALAINGITTTDDDWSRLGRPAHARMAAALRARSFEDAVAVVEGGERSCSTNFLVAQAPDRILDLEAAPRTVHCIPCPESGYLVHTNHFVDARAAGVVEPPIENRNHSENRLARLQALLAERQPADVASLQAHLRDHDDHPYGLCRHPDEGEPEEERYATVTSIVMDPGAGVLWATDGPPCQAPYEEHWLGVPSRR